MMEKLYLKRRNLMSRDLPVNVTYTFFENEIF